MYNRIICFIETLYACEQYKNTFKSSCSILKCTKLLNLTISGNGSKPVKTDPWRICPSRSRCEDTAGTCIPRFQFIPQTFAYRGGSIVFKEGFKILLTSSFTDIVSMSFFRGYVYVSKRSTKGKTFWTHTIMSVLWKGCFEREIVLASLATCSHIYIQLNGRVFGVDASLFSCIWCKVNK
jgi:hypothetical protein